MKKKPKTIQQFIDARQKKKQRLTLAKMKDCKHKQSLTDFIAKNRVFSEQRGRR
jgi:hypothetical protein